MFSKLEKMVDRICETINCLSHDTIMSITRRDWIRDIFENSVFAFNIPKEEEGFKMHKF